MGSVCGRTNKPHWMQLHPDTAAILLGRRGETDEVINDILNGEYAHLYIADGGDWGISVVYDERRSSSEGETSKA